MTTLEYPGPETLHPGPLSQGEREEERSTLTPLNHPPGISLSAAPPLSFLPFLSFPQMPLLSFPQVFSGNPSYRPPPFLSFPPQKETQHFLAIIPILSLP